MSPHRSTLFAWLKKAGKLMLRLAPAALALVCVGGIVLYVWMVKTEDEPSAPKRHYNPWIIRQVKPVPVSSAWRFETIKNARKIWGGSLALDSKGNPHIAYGSDRLYYAWSDGSTWRYEIADSRPGQGERAQLVLDARDQPHIVYRVGTFPKMFLAHAYRTPAGWQRETISPEYCLAEIDQVSFDSQGKLMVLYDEDVGSSCSAVDHLWLAQQAASGWSVSQVASYGGGAEVLRGKYASLAYDPTGQAHVSYWAGGQQGLVFATWSGQGLVNQERVQKLQDFFGLASFYEDNGAAHIAYAIHYFDYSVSLKHAWKDSSGWHFEDVRNSPDSATIITAFSDARKRMHIVYAVPGQLVDLVRRETGGWEMASAPTLLPEDYQWWRDIKIDRDGRFHLLYMADQNTMFNYAVQEGEAWQSTEIDRSVDLYSHAALAFDRSGAPAAAFYTSDEKVLYLWKDGDTWREEVVGRGSRNAYSNPIDLLFDPENRPHLFYFSYRQGVSGDNPEMVHAFREKGRWMVERLEGPDSVHHSWSRPVTSPEGWPALYDFVGSKQNTYFAVLQYRAPDGWQQRRLPDLIARDITNYRTQITYAAGPPPALAADGITLPGFVSQDDETGELVYRDPRHEKMEILPVVDNKHGVKDMSLAYDPRGRPVVFANIAPYTGFGELTEPGQIVYITRPGSVWQAYQLAGVQSFPLYAPILDNQGQAHFTDGMKYVTGAGREWKVTPIQGQGLEPTEDSLRQHVAGLALRPDTGEFCALIYDNDKDDLILGCLEKIE